MLFLSNNIRLIKRMALHKAILFIVMCSVTSNCFADPPSITLTTVAGISAGVIEHESNHAGTITIGTNGGVSITGYGLMYDSGANPGQVNVSFSSTPSGIIEIKCEGTAQIASNADRQVLTFQDVEISVNAGVTAGAGHTCNGIAAESTPATTVDTSSTRTIVIYIGGTINVTTNAISSNPHTFSSSNGGGQNIKLRVLFQ